MPGTGATEKEVRERYLAIREKVLTGTATDTEAWEAADLILWMKKFQDVRDYHPKPCQ